MGRAPCCNKDGLKKGPWLPEEDQKLVDFIQENGPGYWRTLPKKAGLLRCGKSCRLRWTNYLRPDIKRGRFTFEEEEAIIQLHSVLGNKWSAIAAKLPGRTDNEIKNYWNTHIRKRLMRMGLDPVTHTRRFDLLNLPSILNSPLQNSSQMNLLKLLSLQSLVNPDLLRLAALLSSNQNQNQNQHQHQQQNLNFLLQNLQANEIANTSGSMEQNQYSQIAQTSNQNQTAFQNNVPVFGDSLVMQPGLEERMTAFPNFEAHNFGTQTSSLVNDQWQSNVLLNSDSAVQQQQQQQQDDSQYVSNTQVISDFLLNTPDFKSGNSNNNPSLSSVLSTPCTSQETPLNSNSEYPSSNEDEIDSYCQSLMNFDIPDDFFNVC